MKELSDKELEQVVAGKSPLSIVSLSVSTATTLNKLIQDRKKEQQNRSLFKGANSAN